MKKIDQRIVINLSMTIKDAMRVINQGISKTAFLVENEKLVGTLTDGDIRRHLLSGGNLDEKISKIVNYNPKYIIEGEKLSPREYMLEQKLTEIPIVDVNKRILRIEQLRPSKKNICSISDKVPVVVMAGGLGSRLKPYTEVLPKPLIPIGNKTILEYIFDLYELFGCHDKYVILNYKKNLIEAYFKDLGKYENLHFIEEPFFMGTAGGIKLVKENCHQDFFLTNCDILIDADYYEIWKQHRENRNIITMVLVDTKFVIPYGVIETDGSNKVEKLVEKPSMQYQVNSGMYLCNSKVFDYISDEKIDMTEVIQRCIDANEKVGYILVDETDWYDMGQPNKLEDMKERLLGKQSVLNNC